MANVKFEVAVRPVVLSADPAIEPEGSVYYNSTTDTLRKSDGSAWSDVGSSGSQKTFPFFVS